MALTSSAGREKLVSSIEARASECVNSCFTWMSGRREEAEIGAEHDFCHI